MAIAPAQRTDAARDFVAHSEIATNLARHSRGVDRNDAALLASAYTPDATVAYGLFEGPAHQFATILTDAMEGAPTTLHRTANMAIRVDGDRARSESYVIAYTRTPEDGGAGRQRLIGGRYLDRHEHRDGAWRIAHRTYVMDWNTNVDSREIGPTSGLHGAQRQGDPAHALFATVRADQNQGDMPMGSLEEALAKQALHDLIVTYARGVDRGDEATLATVFHRDAEVVTGVIDGKGPDFAREIVAMVRGSLKSCFHSVANEYFEVSGDTAAGETYVVAHMLTLGETPQETLTGGRYLDRFERRDGRWRIARRTFVHDWSMTQPATMEEAGMYESLRTRGGWAPDDPSVAFWRD